MKVKSFSHARLLVTPWTAAYQAPPSMGFSRQEYWSGVPLLSLEILCYQVIFKKPLKGRGFPGGSDSEESAHNAGDPGSIPGSGRSLEEEVATHSSVLAWRIPGMGAWWAAVYGVAQSQT